MPRFSLVALQIISVLDLTLDLLDIRQAELQLIITLSVLL
jgi:hypothetical protein